MKALLDEMFSAALAERLRRAGRDVVAVHEDPALEGLADPKLFDWCREHGRAIVTYNVADFVVLAKAAEAAGTTHAGIIGVSSKAFPQHPGSQAALIAPLEKFVAGDPPWPNFVLWLT